MANLAAPFNALQHDPEMGAGKLPVGAKQAVIAVESEIKSAKENQNNGFVSFTLEIIDGPNKGMRGPARFNVYNSNGDASRIAYNQLAAMSIAAGLPMWTNTEELHNRPFLIDVVPQRIKDGQEDKGYTEIAGYYDMGGNKPTKAGPQPQQQQQQQQNNNQGGQGDWNNQQQQQQPQQSNQTGYQVDQNVNMNQQQQQPQQQQQQQQNWNNQQQQQQQPQNNQQQQNWNGNQSQPNNQGGNTPPWNK